MTQALTRFDGYAKDVAVGDGQGGRAGTPVPDGSISYLDGYRRPSLRERDAWSHRDPRPSDHDRSGEREIVGTRVTTVIVIDETPLIRLIRTVVIALLVATACLLLVWVANLRATPIPDGPAPLPGAAVVTADTSAAVDG